MRVYLDEALFEDDDPLPATSLISLAREGRHRILLRPAFQADDDRELPRTRWLRDRDERTRRPLVELLKLSAQEASRGRPEAPRITVVGGSQSQWDTGHLSVPDAMRLLRAPLRLLVENGRNDWIFLLAMFDRAYRQTLQDAEREQWVVTEGGGLGEIEKTLADLLSPGSRDWAWQVKRLRTWVMFDRDAHVDDPRLASLPSERVRSLCQRLFDEHQGPWRFSYFPLPRRAIESYLPLEALADQALAENSVDRHDALRRLREHHPTEAFGYSMKEGFIKDASGVDKRERARRWEQWKRALTTEERCSLVPADDLPPAWRALPAELLSDLLFGFGKKVADAFACCDTEALWDEWFDREYDRGPAGQPSRSEIALRLLELI